MTPQTNLLRMALVLFAVALLVACGGEEPKPDATPGPADSVKVKISDFKLSPQEVELAKGGKVTWINKDAVDHNVTVDGADCDKLIKPGKSVSCTFSSEGIFSYMDRLNNQVGLKGKIKVQ